MDRLGPVAPPAITAQPARPGLQAPRGLSVMRDSRGPWTAWKQRGCSRSRRPAGGTGPRDLRGRGADWAKGQAGNVGS